MAKVVNKYLSIADPHEIIMSLCESGDVPLLTEGTTSDFKFKTTFFVVMLFVLKSALGNYIPTFLDVGIVLLISYLAIDTLWKFFKYNNRSVKTGGVSGLLTSVLALIGFIAVLGLF